MTDIINKRGVIYHRVSTGKQSFGASLEQQKNCCSKIAENNGIEIVEIFKDKFSAKDTENRPNLKNMLQYIVDKKNQISCVIVYKIDRLTRNVGDYSNLLKIFRAHKISLISASESVDETPMGKFLGTLTAASAQLDNDMKSERVSDCMMHKVKQGYWVWKACLGYLNGRTKSEGKVVILDEKKAPILRKAFFEYSTGLYTLENIRKRMNELGLKTYSGKEVSAQFMCKIITNKFYIGIMTVNGEEYPGVHKKLIDEETFYKCQSVLKGNTRPNSISASKLSKEAFPLRHNIVCAYCGRPLTAYFATGRWGGKYPYYRCYNKNCQSKKSVPKKILEGEFKKLLSMATPTEKFLKAFKAVILDVWKTEYEKLNFERDLKSKRLEQLGEDKIKLIEMKKKELLSDEDFREAFNKIKVEIEERQMEMNTTKIEEFRLDEAVEYVFTYIKQLPNNWEHATFEDKIRLLGLIFSEKPRYDFLKFKTPKFSPILQTKKELGLSNSSLVPPRGIEPLFSP